MAIDIVYAGVPFCSDVAQVVGINVAGFDEINQENDIPNKHLPLADLVDEIDRNLPFSQLDDFSYPGPYFGRNFTAIASRNEVKQRPSPNRLYEWYYPTTASKWSMIYCLATSSLVIAMRNATGGGKTKASFTISYNDQASASSVAQSVSTMMYMLPPRPIGETGGTFDGMYLITLVDERYYFQGTPVSLEIQNRTTWSDLLTQLQSALGVTINIPSIDEAYTYPELDSQLWSQGQTAATLFDAIAYNIGRVVVRNLSGTYDLLTPIESSTRAFANNNYTSGTLTAGGNIFNSGGALPIGNERPFINAAVPSAIKIYFPYYVEGDDPVPHFLNKRYQAQRRSVWYEEGFGGAYEISVPITSGGPTVSGMTGVSTINRTMTAKALISGEADARSGVDPTNQSGLMSMALRVARDEYEYRAAAAFDQTYPGVIEIQQDGIHDIIWTFSVRRRQATTRMTRPSWSQSINEFQQLTPVASGYTGTVRGIGGPSVAQSYRDSFGESGSFRGLGGPFIVSGTATSGMVVGSGVGESGYRITSGTYQAGDLVGSGGIRTTLSRSLSSGETTAYFTSIDYFPTANRWRGRVNDEVILFEGTSGGVFNGSTPNRVDIVYREIDGTTQPLQHDSLTPLYYITPNTNYGTNLVTHEKMQFVHPRAWTSGGIQEAVIKPQTQSVMVLDGSGIILNNTYHYSGVVLTYDPTLKLSGPWIKTELIWCVDRNAERYGATGLLSGGTESGLTNSGTAYSGQSFSGQLMSGQLFSGDTIQPKLISGLRYDGQIVGYSIWISGKAKTAPIYAVDRATGVTSQNSILAQLTGKYYANVISTGGSGGWALADPNFTPYSWQQVYDDVVLSGTLGYSYGPLSGGFFSGMNPAFQMQNIDYPAWPAVPGVIASGYLISGALSGAPIMSGIGVISGYGSYSGGYFSGYTVSGGGIQPLSIVRLYPVSGGAYMFDQNPWTDLFRRTNFTDAAGIIAYHRIWNQNSGLWMDGQEVRLVVAE